MSGFGIAPTTRKVNLTIEISVTVPSDIPDEIADGYAYAILREALYNDDIEGIELSIPRDEATAE